MEILILAFIPYLYPKQWPKSVLSFSLSITMEYKKTDDTS